tara:strand:- start:395 stop:544 length:150 start_codon:yes stop_codon:yes gene_type:complete
MGLIVAMLFVLSASIAPAWAMDVGHDCAEGADEYIIADTKDKPKPLAGV